jgi:hypothetical protein
MEPQGKLNAWVLSMTDSIVDVELSDDFFQIARNIYQEDPFWIPESEEKIKQQFSADNPYFNRGQVKVFCYDTDTRLVGFYNPDIEIEGERIVYFGFWESQNNIAINKRLFLELENWGRHIGASRIYGPINFSTYQNNRLRIDNFDKAPFIDEPYNPEYYPLLLQQLGFEKKFGYTSAINQSVDNLVAQVDVPFQGLKKQTEGLFVFEKLTGKVWLENLEQLYPLVDSIFSENFAYTPISWENFQSLCGESFAKKLCPHSSVIVRDVEGKIAGFFITYPDYGSLVNQQSIDDSGVKLTASEINYSDHYSLLKQPRLLLAKTCGVAPKYRSAKLFPLMSMQLSLWAKGYYEHVSAAMVRDDNASMSFYKSLEKAGNKDFITRGYALFTKSITASGEVNE